MVPSQYLTFLQNIYNRDPLTRPWRWDVGCLLQVQIWSVSSSVCRWNCVHCTTFLPLEGFFHTWYRYSPIREDVSCKTTFDLEPYLQGHLLMTLLKKWDNDHVVIISYLKKCAFKLPSFFLSKLYCNFKDNIFLISSLCQCLSCCSLLLISCLFTLASIFHDMRLSPLWWLKFSRNKAGRKSQYFKYLFVRLAIAVRPQLSQMEINYITVKSLI